MEDFSQVPVRPKLNHMHTFGCPVYVLDSQAQEGQKLPKWHIRACMGVNLGPSYQHAQTVTLVLNLLTGQVSPQFHVKFDDAFKLLLTQGPTRFHVPEVITPNKGDIPQLNAPPIRRSKRAWKPTQHILESNQQETIAFATQSLETSGPEYVAFAKSSDPDVMHLHQALRQPDHKQFLAAMQKEVEDHTQRKHWQVIQ